MQESAPRTDMARIGRFEAIQNALCPLYRAPDNKAITFLR